MSMEMLKFDRFAGFWNYRTVVASELEISLEYP
jgi:hypothetical protein